MTDQGPAGTPRDPGAAFERTTLAWNRTGLSSVAVGVLVLQVFWERGAPGLALAALFFGIGALAYLSGARAPVDAARLRLGSVAVGAAAVLSGVLSVTGR